MVAKSLRDKLGIDNGDAAEPKKMDQDSLEDEKDDSVARYIEKRPHGVYRFRYWVSKKLQKQVGQREIRKTLRTVVCSDLN